MSEAKAEVEARGWKVGKELGQGAFGKVMLVTRESDGQQAAVKIVKKPTQESKMKVVKMEEKILKSVSHPSIVACFDVFETEKNMYFIMELMSGGELFDRIVKIGSFTEKMAKELTVKMLTALQYMHEQGVCHRDLKPENMLLTSDAADAEVKITDFGLAKMIDEQTTIMKTACGTPGYVAPEVITQGGTYGFGVDVWSYGVILYILLCGFPPFYGDNDAQMMKAIKAGKYEFLKPFWDPISAEAKDFVTKMLVVDATQRATIPELLKHPWIKDAVAQNEAATATGRRRSIFTPDATDAADVNLAKFDEYPIQETAKKLNGQARLRKSGLAVILSNRLSGLGGSTTSTPATKSASPESEEATTATTTTTGSPAGAEPVNPDTLAVNIKEEGKGGGCCVIA